MTSEPNEVGAGFLLGLAENLHGLELVIFITGLISPPTGAWLLNRMEFRDALILTLPLTLAVGLLVAAIRAKALGNLEHPFYGYAGLAPVLLVTAAIFSFLFHVGGAPDWTSVLREAFDHFPKNLTIIILAPLALLEAYLKLYQPRAHS